MSTPIHYALELKAFHNEIPQKILRDGLPRGTESWCMVVLEDNVVGLSQRISVQIPTCKLITLILCFLICKIRMKATIHGVVQSVG